MTHITDLSSIWPYLLPASIMFFITIGFTALFFLPALKFRKKNPLINFYWAGFWVFLAIIAATSGAANILLILKHDTSLFSNAALAGISASFVFFVMFAWVRLSGTVILRGLSRAYAKVSQKT